MATKSKINFYIVHCRDPLEGKNLTLKVKEIKDSPLGLSFVCLSDFIFEEKSLVINPSEEHLKNRFQGIQKFHLSIYNILAIEEVGEEHEGLSFEKDKSNVFVLPGNPGPESPKK